MFAALYGIIIPLKRHPPLQCRARRTRPGRRPAARSPPRRGSRRHRNSIRISRHRDGNSNKSSRSSHNKCNTSNNADTIWRRSRSSATWHRGRRGTIDCVVGGLSAFKIDVDSTMTEPHGNKKGRKDSLAVLGAKFLLDGACELSIGFAWIDVKLFLKEQHSIYWHAM